jgi:hypothetical protein
MLEIILVGVAMSAALGLLLLSIVRNNRSSSEDCPGIVSPPLAPTDPEPASLSPTRHSSRAGRGRV